MNDSYDISIDLFLDLHIDGLRGHEKTLYSEEGSVYTLESLY